MTCPLRPPPHPYVRIFTRHDDLSTASSSTSLRSDLHPPRCPVHCVLLHILTLGSSSATMTCPLRSPPHPYARILLRHDDLSTASSSTSLRSDLHPPRCPVHCVLLHILTLGSSSATMTCPLRPPPHPYVRIFTRHDDLSTASSSTSLRSDLHPPRCPVHCVLLHILTLGSSSATMTCPLRPPPHPYVRIFTRHDVLSTAFSSTSLRSDPPLPR